MKCYICETDTSEYSDGYCLRCEKIAAEVDSALTIGCQSREGIV